MMAVTPKTAPVAALLLAPLCLLLAAGLAQAREITFGGDPLTLQFRSSTLADAIRQGFPEGEIELPSAVPGRDPAAMRVSARVRGVPRDQFLHAILTAAGMEAEEVGGKLWVTWLPDDDDEQIEWEDLDGFQEFFLGRTDILTEARMRALPRLDPLTRAYLEYREDLKTQRVNPDEVRGGKSFLGIRLASPGRTPGNLPEGVREVLAKWDGWGCFVLDVVPESPAARSGILPGDVIIKFAGLWVDSPNTLVRLVSRAQADREYELEVLRGGGVRREWAVVAERPATRRAPANRR